VHAETPTRRHVSKVGVSACGKDTKLLVKMGVALAQEVYSTFRKHVMISVKYFRDLDVYQGAMSLVMRIFELTKHFPIEEKYTLTDQVRRSSRSVCANLAEAWRKRRYRAAFVSKLNDAESEAAETQVHVEIAFRHSYLKQEVFDELDDACDKILAQIVKMIDHADRWIIKARPDPPPHEDAETPTRRYADTSPPQASG
jgi:four helix bundle protein